jgi:hypothetical protein
LLPVESNQIEVSYWTAFRVEGQPEALPATLDPEGGRGG